MDRRSVTLKDVARAVGVHVSTVSRALDPKSRHLITPEVVEKVLKVSAEMRYRPNVSAYSLRTNRTRTVGVMVPDITNPIFPPIIRGIEEAFERAGYVAMVANTDNRMERDEAIIEMFLARGVDGLITASVPRESQAVADIAAAGTAIVTVNRRVDAAEVSSVVNDEETGVGLVLEHLFALGHRRVAHIAGPQELSTGLRRAKAYLAAARRLGLPVEESLIAYAATFREAEGERCAEELLARGTGFTALLCANDRLAIGALDALRRAGLACPGDVSITGFNDMAMIDRLTPPLTTVRIQQYEAGRRAAQIVLQLIETGGEAEPVHEVLPVELVVRRSTAAPRRTPAAA